MSTVKLLPFTTTPKDRALSYDRAPDGLYTNRCSAPDEFLFNTAPDFGGRDGEIGRLARFCSKSSGVRDRRAPGYATRQWPAEPQPL